MKYRTVDGEILDAICARFYGVGKFDIGIIYDANQGLANHGAIIPKGTIIILPEQAALHQQRAPIRLWS